MQSTAGAGLVQGHELHETWKRAVQVAQIKSDDPEQPISEEEQVALYVTLLEQHITAMEKQVDLKCIVLPGMGMESHGIPPIPLLEACRAVNVVPTLVLPLQLSATSFVERKMKTWVAPVLESTVEDETLTSQEK